MDADSWLVNYLDGGVRPSVEGRALARRAGISERRLRGALKSVGVQSLPSHGHSPSRPWFWVSPQLTLREARDRIGEEIGIPWIED
jgi:hypothetical protein